MPLLQPKQTKYGTGKNFYVSSGDLPSQTLEYALPSGTNGGAAPGANVFYPRPMNRGLPALDVNGNSYAILGLTLNVGAGGTQITLPIGTYLVQALACGLMTTQQTRIYDVVNNVVIANGLSVGAESRNNVAPVYTEFTLAEPTIIEIQFCGAQAFGAQDWGQACNFGGEEIYLQVIITKEV